MTNPKPSIVSLAAALSLAFGAARAQEPFAYPPAGRTPEAQKQDQYDCHQWAAEQSHFDPVQYASQAGASSGSAGAQPASRSYAGPGVVYGAARGAAIAEAADEDSGDGAAAGAALNLLRQRRAHAAEQQQAAARAQPHVSAEQQQAAELAAKRDAYQRAKSTCLKARGYTLSEV